jgi:thiamine pyrophosphokinase
LSSETIVSNDSPVCFVGGASIAENAISAVFSHVEAFIGVDGGADHLLAASVTPAAVIGDLDSLSAQARATFGPQLCYVAEQLTTDFEKALIRVKTPLVLALGFTGGRLDHTLSVLSVMARYDDRAIILVDAQDVSFVARLGQTSFDVPEDVRVSIMPLTVATVTVSGLQWPFTETRMTMDGFTSASNAAIGGAVSIQTDGPVLVTLPRAFLPIAMQAAARG